jgi:hypothetical protein
MKTGTNRFRLFPDFTIYELEHQYSGNDKMDFLPRIIELKTTIRKEQGKKWYLWDVIFTRSINPLWTKEEVDIFKINVFRRFIEECYLVIILGKVDQKIVSDDELKIFVQDENQEPEKDRLTRLNSY